MKRFTTAMATGLMALSLTACGNLSGGGDSSTQDVEAGSISADALKGVTVSVGSKEFDEQLLLGQITLLSLKAAGAEVEDNTNIQGSTQAREALIKGDTDVYWDYTGTGWITYLGHDKPIPDEQKLYEAVKKEDLQKNGLVWGQLAPFNNTYAFAVSSSFAEKTGVKTDSDMAQYIQKNPDATVCIEAEFGSRPDGYPGFKKAYGISGGTMKSLGTGVIYPQTAENNCDFGEVFTTDGRIKALDLVVLQDDKKFFPLYNGVPIVREDIEKEHPEVLEVLAPVAKKLDTETMAELNAKVSSEGQKPEDVAAEWLKQEGFIK